MAETKPIGTGRAGNADLLVSLTAGGRHHLQRDWGAGKRYLPEVPRAVTTWTGHQSMRPRTLDYFEDSRCGYDV